MEKSQEGRNRLMRRYMVSGVVVALIFFLCACEQEEEQECNSRVVSAAGATSHMAGRNCMNCHRPNGGGSGCFVVAGTMYDSAGTSPVAGAVLHMRTLEAGGDLRLMLVSDLNGNFYTTEPVDFSGGMYPCVSESSGSPSCMQYAVTLGSCNCCHGVTAGRVRIK